MGCDRCYFVAIAICMLSQSHSNLAENEEMAAEKSEDPGDKTEEGEKSSVESSLPECENENETRQRSIQKLRGILKESMAAGAVVRNIKFLVEAGESAPPPPPRAQARLRSPPPALCSLPLSAEEEEAEAGQIFLTLNIFQFVKRQTFLLFLLRRWWRRGGAGPGCRWCRCPGRRPAAARRPRSLRCRGTWRCPSWSAPPSAGGSA